MRNKILFLGLLSTTMFSYAQDSLSIQQTFGNTPEKQVSDNNIRNIQLQTAMHQSLHPTWGTTPNKECQYQVKPNTDLFFNYWSTGWFINAAAGMGAFIGEPLGCEDLFGRSLPMYHLSIGKWFNPTAGGRIAYQGLNLKSHLLQRQKYYHVHADFMLNTTNLFHQSYSQTFWQIIPFVGAGIIQNSTTHKHPFTLNYGILNQFRLSNRLSLSLELGGLTTFSDFDGAGKGNRLNDHLFHLSAGFTITLGKNERSCSSVTHIYSHGQSGTSCNTQSQSINSTEFAEYPSLADTTISGCTTYPKNNYSGLNSLRERLSCTLAEETSTYQIDWFEQTDTLSNTSDTLSVPSAKKLQSITWEYLNQLTDRKAPIGTPVFFFFRIGTTNLTDTSQLVNLDAIATLCEKFNLCAIVTGYADSATGNSVGNCSLSEERAEYITTELIKRGMDEKSTAAKAGGGISTYSPNEANRCVKVEIFFKQ